MPEKNILISWAAPEFNKYEKSFMWYLVCGLIAAIVFIIAIFTKNYIFAFIVLLLSFLFFTYTKKNPRQIEFSIAEEGIFIDEKLCAFNEIISFWIFEKPELTLSLETKKPFQNRITIPLPEKDPLEIKKILLEFTKEIQHEEHLSDIISRKIKF